jgi:hypothetical protein
VSIWTGVNSKATTKVFIVGHTDMQGAVDHSMGFSLTEGMAHAEERSSNACAATHPIDRLPVNVR